MCRHSVKRTETLKYDFQTKRKHCISQISLTSAFSLLDTNTEMLAMTYIDHAESLNITIEPAGGNDHPTVSKLITNIYMATHNMPSDLGHCEAGRL